MKKYKLLEQGDYAHIQDEHDRVVRMEHDFFETRKIEKIFRMLDFIGMELPTHLNSDERVFLFNDRTLDQDFFLEAEEDKKEGKAYRFISKFYLYNTYISYSSFFKIIEEN
ncbi:MAG: hypothetical protein IJ220_02990 [Clostridia bacterium]|nr:hypothetical protein [Clostridia bacterium]